MAITSSTLAGNAVSNIQQTSVDVTFSASVTGTSFGATEVVFISGSFTSNQLATMTAVTTPSTTRSVASAAHTITGLSSSTTYTGALHLRGISTGTDIRIGTSFSFTTASPPPPPPTQSYAPTISGTGISGTSVSATAGGYSGASSVTTTIARNTTGTFSGSSSSYTTPHTVTDSDAASPPYYFAAMDTVVGNNGTTYYYYSSSTILTKLLVSFDSQSGSSANSISYVAGASITLPSTTRSGYIFNGWYTAASGGTRVGGASSSYTPSTTTSVTLYAQWSVPAPTAPTYLTASNGTYSDKISLSFGGASGTISGFHIWWGASATGRPTDTSTPDFTITTTNTYGSYDNTGLSQSTNRWYWVRATGPGGNSAWYPSISGSPIPDGIAGSTSVPLPPSQNSSPSISGTGVTGTTLTAYSGTYSNYQTITTAIAYDVGSFPPGTLRTHTSPYTVTESDASNTPYNFATVDTVLGNDGKTYYYYSNSITSKLLVSFNVQNGSSVSNISYISNPTSPNSIQLPYTSRANYSFNGWYTAASGGSLVGGAYSSYQPPTTGSITLYAQWTPFPVSQNYSPSISGTGISGDSLAVTSGSYNYVSTTAPNPIVTSIAYNVSGIFSGNINSQLNGYTVTDIDASLQPYYFAAKDTVIGIDGLTYYYYSSPTISKLKVSFNSNSGNYTPGPIAYIAASPANSITLPYTYKDNYSFNGWYTAASGGTRVGGIYDSYQPSTSASITLYAQWTITPITKYYSPSISGSGISGESLNAYSGGYSSNGTYLGTSIAYSAADNFSSYDGTNNNPFSTRSSTYTITDADAKNPPYYFAAVDSIRNAAGTVFYYYSSSIESRFKVTYDYQYSGIVDSVTFFSASTNPTLILPSPSRQGYTFTGWYNSQSGGTLIGGAGTNYVPADTNITIYAQWIATQYTLTFDPNGGSVSPTSKLVTSGDQYGTLPTPQRAGYTFIGWYSDLSYSSQIFSYLTYDVGSNSRIYAKWQGNSYVLTLYPNFPLGGKSDGFYSQNNITYGSAYGELPTLTRTGYTFSGWFDSVSGGTKILSTDLYLLEQNSDLYAQWIATTPVFSDQTITTTAYLNKDVNTLLDNSVAATPVTSYSIVYSGSGLDPSSWISISKESGTNHGLLSGKPTQIGVYTFVVRATNSGSGNTDSGLITLTVLPVGKRSLDSSMTSLTVAKRFDGTNWINMKVMKRFDGTYWQDIGNI